MITYDPTASVSLRDLKTYMLEHERHMMITDLSNMPTMTAYYWILLRCRGRTIENTRTIIRHVLTQTTEPAEWQALVEANG
jgi:hypothetical protein